MGKKTAAKTAGGGAASTRTALVSAGWNLLDKDGLGAVTLKAAATGAGVIAIDADFDSRADLLEAMALHLLAAVPPALPEPASLRVRAQALHQLLTSRRDAALLVAHAPDALTATAQGEPATLLVDRFVLGWTLAARAGPQAAASNDFSTQLDTVLAGISATRSDGRPDGTTAPGSRPQLFQSDLWLLLRTVRESADIAYARTMPLNELDRRMLLLLEAHGNLTPAELSATTGVDKAQVSRAVKRITELALIDRTGIRSPLSLTAEGSQITERMMRLAELRNRELIFGLDDADILNFFSVLEELMARAVLLYEQERKLAANARLDVASEDAAAEDPVSFVSATTIGDAMVMERARILPPLIALSSYTMRSAALAFKRLTGLSNFEAWVLVEIGKEPPMPWSRLVLALDRDHSQAGRTVRRLIEIGLIEREGEPGRRHGSFSPTAEGLRLNEILRHVGDQRSHFLLENVDPAKLQRFLANFDAIARNAEAQLGRERALEEIDPNRG